MVNNRDFIRRTWNCSAVQYNSLSVSLSHTHIQLMSDSHTSRHKKEATPHKVTRNGSDYASGTLQTWPSFPRIHFKTNASPSLVWVMQSWLCAWTACVYQGPSLFLRSAWDVKHVKGAMLPYITLMSSLSAASEVCAWAEPCACTVWSCTARWQALDTQPATHYHRRRRGEFKAAIKY